LAQDLNVSIGTVSRALNGKPDVNEETRRRVMEAAAAIGYVPNQAGRSLRKGTTGVVGFMMQTGSQITGEGEVFFMSVFDGVQTVFARHQLDLVALLCSSEEDPDAYMQRVLARGFADADSHGNLRRVIVLYNHIGGFNGGIAAQAAHGNAYIAEGYYGCVIYPVACKSYRLITASDLFYTVHFVFGQEIAESLVNSQVFRYILHHRIFVAA